MSYRPAIAIAIICFASLIARDSRQSNQQVAQVSQTTACSILESHNLSFGVGENQSNIAPTIPVMQPFVEGEFLPNEVFSPAVATTSTYDFQPYGNVQYAFPESQDIQYQHVPYTPIQSTHPAMQVGNYNLFQYRRMMRSHSSPSAQEMQGAWRGINKGLATVAIDEQFIKHFQNINGQMYGDNISVHQVPLNQVYQNGWRPEFNGSTGALERKGKFKVTNARGIGAFRHGLILSYRDGGNSRRDPSRLIEDRVVKLDDNHMLGRAAVRFGPFRIPLAYFVLERVQ